MVINVDTNVLVLSVILKERKYFTHFGSFGTLINRDNFYLSTQCEKIRKSNLYMLAEEICQ